MVQAASDYSLIIPCGGPLAAQRVWNALHVIPEQYDEWTDNKDPDDLVGFLDWKNRHINVLTTKKKKPFVPIGINRALWDLANGNLALDPDGEHIWRRDMNKHGSPAHGDPSTLGTWHEIASIEQEYDVPSGVHASSWQDLIVTNLLGHEDSPRVQKAIKFGNLYVTREDEKVVTKPITDDNRLNPMFLTVPADFDENVAQHTHDVFSRLVEDDNSLDNLLRLWVENILGPYNTHLYVLYGGGGNGKGVLLGALGKEFPNRAKAFDAKWLCSGGFQAVQEAMRFSGTAWNYDTDADTITPDELKIIKKIASHESIVGRLQGKNNVEITPNTCMIIASNNPVITDMTRAYARRFVYVRFRDDVSDSDIDDLLAIRDKYGAAAWLMASCVWWMAHPGAKDAAPVSISDPAQLSDLEYLVVSEIVKRGYCANSVLSEKHYRLSAFSKHVLLDKLGLTSVTRRVDGKSARVMEPDPKYHQRFDIFARAVRQQLDNAAHETATIPEMGTTFDLEPNECGFKCSLVPAGQDSSKPKVAINWKKNAQKRSQVRPKGSIYGVVPDPGWCVIDLDKPKEGRSGLDVLTEEVGDYGTTNLPKTLTVKSPHGGYHLYYRVPAALQGKLKNAAGLGFHTDKHPTGVPVDVRCEGKGTVSGPGSYITETETGKDGKPQQVKKYYTIIQLPPLAADKKSFDIPCLSSALCRWLEQNGYVADSPMTGPRVSDARAEAIMDHALDPAHHPAPAPASKQASAPKARQKSAQKQASESKTARPVTTQRRYVLRDNWRKDQWKCDERWHNDPDLSPIPQGSRDDTIFRQTVGRLTHYPNNKDEIIREEMDRATASGLSEQEARATIRSAIRNAGLE